jgi:hypothetical protein
MHASSRLRQALVLAFTVAPLLMAPISSARASDIDPADLKPYCEGPFKFEAGSKSCVADDAALKALDNPAKCTGPALQWQAPKDAGTAGSCTAVAGQLPKPICNPKVLGSRFKDGKCVISLSPEEDRARDFFADWAVGIAVIQPKVASITDASIVGGKVRINGVIRQQSALLVARHFYPWNPGRRCVQGGTFANDEKGRGTFLGGTQGFLSNCVGMMVAAAAPTSGAVNGQIINFLGLGLSVGGGITGADSYNWHFGIGVGRKFNTRVLGDGWVEGEAPPDGEESIRYKDIDVSARFAYFTFRW